jgi:hypothetical protein
MFKILTGLVLAGLALAGFNLVGGHPPFQPFYTGPLPVLSSPSATPTPAQAPAAPQLIAPTGGASSTAKAAPSLIPLSPSAAPVMSVAWTAADCSWAAATLGQDASLDSAEAAALQAGTDTRYPLSDIPYYRQEASDWTTLAGWIATACQSGQYPTRTDIAEAAGWVTQALASHENDASLYPQDAAWDTQWEQNYDRLIGMLGTALDASCADGAACAQS